MAVAQDWTTNKDLIQELYVAFYGRPGDPGGIKYWAEQLPDNATLADTTTKDLVRSFIRSGEARTRIGNVDDPLMHDSIIEKIYFQLFHREVLQNEIDSFKDKPIEDVLVSILNPAAGTTDATTLSTKLQYANWFVQALDPNGDGIANDSADGTHFAAEFNGNVDASDVAAKMAFIDYKTTTLTKADVLTDIQTLVVDPGEVNEANDIPLAAPTITTPVAGDNMVDAAERASGFTVTGRAEAGARVTLTVTDGAGHAVTKTATADSKGNYGIALNPGDGILVDGNLILSAKATDAEGNTSQPTTKTVLLDTTIPVFVSAETNASSDKVILTYNEALDASHGPAAGDFTVKVNGKAVALDATTPVTVSDKTVTLKLASAVTGTDTLTVSYTDPNPGQDDTTGVIQDLAGNDAASILNQTVTNNVPGAFAVYLNEGVVTFDGNKGNITMTVDANHVATFSSGDVVASTKPDLDDVNSIIVDNGWTLSASVGDMSLAKSVIGDGNVVLTSSADHRAEGSINLRNVHTTITFQDNALYIAEGTHGSTVAVNNPSVTGGAVAVHGVNGGNVEALEVSGTPASDTIDLSRFSTTDALIFVLGMEGADTVTLSNSATEEVIYHVSTHGGDTINSFDTNDDHLVIRRTDFGGSGVSIFSTGYGYNRCDASSTSKANLAAPVDNFNGVIRILGDAASDWSDVVTVVNGAITGSNSGVKLILAIDNYHDTRVYFWNDGVGGNADSSVQAGELTQICTLVGVGDAQQVTIGVS